MNHGDHRTISHPITRLRARRTVTQENFTAAREARKATLRKQPVVNSDALLDAGVTPKIVPAIDPGWVALNRDLAPLDTDRNRCGVTAFVSYARLACRQMLTSQGIDSHAEYVTHDRKVVRKLLSNA